MTRIAYFDCWNGAAGDMLVGALLDAGGDFERLKAALEPLGGGGFTVSFDHVMKNGLVCGKFRVRVKGDDGGPQPASHHDADAAHEGHHGRGLSEVSAIIDAAALPEPVKQTSKRVFARLAQAESEVHGISVEEVHFHEVGALDAIADVVGACFLLHDLGVEQVRASPLPIGRGMVRAAHGLMPVPAPATLKLLKGIPTFDNGERGELVTPTGAAVLATLATGFGPPPSMTIRAAGYGAGDRDHEKTANALRVVLADVEEARGPGAEALLVERLALLEANVDDMTGQQVAFLVEELFAAGAKDAWSTPIVMKKGRPAATVTALCDAAIEQAVQRTLFARSTTLGVRVVPVERRSLPREMTVVATRFGDVPVKVARFGDLVRGQPEYEDCARLARQHGVPLDEVQAAARAAWEASR